MNRDFAEAVNEKEEIEPDEIKRSPAVEYGYEPSESPYAGCVDCYQEFVRTLRSMYGE